ncbi:hypothetical protein LVD15_11960 [Fulvivirga maritima]|uniref:hypothetical protein n=1 Tax=Fulvivirga maritima TaxID=2904247 RepID=UPI001F2309A9|nr:hypothetical protein [Fulvivirga maritima]UII29110.1 hypothetical protein LVD15_11960 [Fulvivirga maritima]
MKLEAGFYKIREDVFCGKCHYIRVFYQGKEKYFQLNHYPPQRCDDGKIPIDGIKFEKKLRRPLTISKVKITFEWTDVDGDDFQVTFRDIQLFRTLFDHFPELAKASGAHIRKWKK